MKFKNSIFVFTLWVSLTNFEAFGSQDFACDGSTNECGLCGENATSCRKVEGIFDVERLRVGYNDILLIPSGATNIRIEERLATNNYLAVRNINGEFYLNGNWRIQFPRAYRFAGTTFHYYSKRRPFRIVTPESLRSDGPTTEPLVIVLLYREPHKGLIFQYTVPSDQQTPVQHLIYTWVTSEFSACTKSCGTGFKIRPAVCVRITDQLPVSDSLCDPIAKPITKMTCNAEPCAEWFTSEWSQCLCRYGVQHRLVYCRSVKEGQTTNVLSDNECLALNHTKPSALNKCVPDSECPAWTTGNWSECDSRCGLGTQVRDVSCALNETDVVDDECDPSLRPKEKQECADILCEGVEWITSEWSSCDSQCGPQVQTRQVLCANESGTIYPMEACDSTRMPEVTRVCDDPPECTPIWFTSEWSSCSVDCGDGLQTRHVFCGHFNEKSEIIIDEEIECSIEKPVNVSVCHLADCQNTWFTAPYGLCTVPCSGGQKSRKTFCLNGNNSLSSDEECDSPVKPVTKEDCKAQECEDDQLVAISGCKDTEFGCCPDDISPALDSSYSGCPPINMTDGCNITEFGCCRDQKTASFGPFWKGCAIICNYTRFGCCPDGITPANSTDLEGCPVETEATTVVTYETTTADMTTTTISPKELDELSLPPNDCGEEGSGEGSGDVCIEAVPDVVTGSQNCSNSTFGCCSDGLTPATGPNFEGCGDGSGQTTDEGLNCTDTTCIPGVTEGPVDCNATEFGCCPNGKKLATGPRYYGCTCEDFPHGCCQDRYTPARGPNYDGCICSRMLYGCCNDGVTPAVGANSEGCSCESSANGCCPDMVSIAKGPNFGGCPCDSLRYGCCPGTETPAPGPNFEGCSCANTPFGCCHDGSTIAYGPKFEGCPSGPALDLRLASEVCGLPKERGPCRNFTVKWYFDIAYGACNRFWYGNCEGNGNRFSSQEQCERSCVTPEGPERCSLPKVNGPCNGSQILWYFNTETKNCDQFVYGGCLGNTNKFETRELCQQICVNQELALDRCDQPPSAGPCMGTYQRWYYRKEDGRCSPFTYGGCKGNQNNFHTEDECRNECGSQTADEICSQAKAEGPCLGTFPRYYFDGGLGLCKEFMYSGCEGNRNRFIDKNTCERTCNKTRTAVAPAGINVCGLPRAEGPCRAAIIQWYFNAESRRCERFYYGGCEGNGNRFDDRALCERTCLFVHLDRNACNLPKEVGNCYDYRERWYYDIEDKRCHRFYYSGCKGNENNFNSFEECTDKCGPLTVASTELSVEHFKSEYCFKPYDSGPCFRNEIRWFYDKSDGVCKEFLYGGCDGNENKFISRSDCEAKCWNSQDICQLSKVIGSCSGRFTQWYFDSNSRECLEFAFSGCHGNANRFNNKENCETQCKTRRIMPWATNQSSVSDVCDQPYETGPCRGYFPRWHYSRHENACKQFIYGGCDGNSNRFETREDCESKCVSISVRPAEGPQESDSPEVVCRMQVESGPCTQTEALWFYDPESHTCLPFVYGGCNGNKNRFKTYELCMRYCSSVSPIQHIPPPTPSQIRPSPVPPVDCPPPECDAQRCPFGIDEYVDERGCSACRCSNPCYIYQCPEDQSCAVEVYRAEKGEPRAQPVCRLKNKPGQCPPDMSASNTLNSDCIDRCRTDADCRADDKCCHNGCAHICVAVEGANATTPQSVISYDSYPREIKTDAHESEIIVTPGSNVTINCPDSEQSAGQPSWSRDGQPLYFVTERVQLLTNGSIQIIGIDNDDAGTYACSSANAPIKYTRLTIHAPARILPGPQIVIAQLGLPSYLQCNAIGNPDPRVTWWKGQQMLPLNSIQYRQYNNFTLLIRKVDDKDGGVYTCQAYNGLGPIALWDVILLLDFDSAEPDIRPYDPNSFNATSIRDHTNYTVNGEIRPIDSEIHSIMDRRPEPVRVQLRTITSHYTIGSTLMLECKVEGRYTSISWFFNHSPLMSDGRHYQVLPNNTLVVHNLTPSDSGEFSCRAANPYTEALDSVPIKVERVFVPPDCSDSPYFANCDLIVNAKYCNNPHYAKFCCRSCLLAGQLDSSTLFT